MAFMLLSMLLCTFLPQLIIIRAQLADARADSAQWSLMITTAYNLRLWAASSLSVFGVLVANASVRPRVLTDLGETIIIKAPPEHLGMALLGMIHGCLHST
jgi:hypothetical protein